MLDKNVLRSTIQQWGGFNVGILYNHGEEDYLDDFNIEFDNQTFRAVCLDKPRHLEKDSNDVAGKNAGNDEFMRPDDAERPKDAEPTNKSDRPNDAERPNEAEMPNETERHSEAEQSREAEQPIERELNDTDQESITKVSDQATNSNQQEDEISFTDKEKERYNFLLGRGAKISSKELEERNALMNKETVINSPPHHPTGDLLIIENDVDMINCNKRKSSGSGEIEETIKEKKEKLT